MVGALHGVLTALGCSYSVAEVSALSGHAFRLAITSSADGEIGAAGPSCFSSGTALPLYEGLGWRFRAIEAAPDDPDYARRRREALVQIGKATDHGLPAIAFGLHIPDFGIVRAVEGRDGEAGASLIVSTTMSPQYGARLPAEQWPAPGRPQPLRVFLPDKRVRVEPATRMTRLLRFAVDYARHGDTGVVPGFPAPTTGIEAYARWAALLEGSEPISPHGQAYCIQGLQEARTDAAAFLRSAAAARPAAAAEFNRAAAAYRAVVLELSRMATLFPFPNGGDVASPGMRRAGALYVRRAFAAEEEAMAAIARASG